VRERRQEPLHELGLLCVGELRHLIFELAQGGRHGQEITAWSRSRQPRPSPELCGPPGEDRVATHDRRGRSVRSTRDEHLPDERAPWRYRSRDYWQERADRIAPEVGAYVRELFDADDVLSMLRAVQATVTHLEKFPRERAAAACVRAQHFGCRSYGAIKSILRQGLDIEPLPSTTCTPVPQLAAPRFARSMSELLHRDAKQRRDDDDLN
jgi:hypothetical protein